MKSPTQHLFLSMFGLLLLTGDGGHGFVEGVFLRREGPQDVEGNTVGDISLPLILNSLLTKIVPKVNDAFQSGLQENFDPYYLNITQRERVGEISLLDGLCEAGVDMNYGIGLLSGLGSLVIDTIAFVPGTESMTGDFVNGRRFGAVMEMITKMQDNRTLVANVLGGVNATVCGINMAQNVNGSAGIYGATGKFRFKMAGSLSLLKGIAELDEVEMDDVAMDYGNMDVTMNNAESSFDDQAIFGGPLSGYVQTHPGVTPEKLNATLGPILSNVTIHILKTILPFEFDAR